MLTSMCINDSIKCVNYSKNYMVHKRIPYPLKNTL